MKRLLVLALALLLAAVFLVGCDRGEKAPGPDKGQTGVLQFKANGEDFVRQGFTSKDGWHISFEHVYVTLDKITGYQSDPAYDAEQGGRVAAQVEAVLPGTFTVDLAEGEGDAEPILVGEVKDATAGHYNAISWEMVQADQGQATNYSLLVIGQAEKDGKTLDFTIGSDARYRFTGGEFVGDERKGILAAGQTADLEMTFHFDHIFGDAGTPADDGLNVGALGFEPFAALAQDGVINAVTLKTNLNAADYHKLMEILPTLGHVGEGHCYHEEM